jgi:hypothetical protein
MAKIPANQLNSAGMTRRGLYPGRLNRTVARRRGLWLVLICTNATLFNDITVAIATNIPHTVFIAKQLYQFLKISFRKMCLRARYVAPFTSIQFMHKSLHRVNFCHWLKLDTEHLFRACTKIR